MFLKYRKCFSKLSLSLRESRVTRDSRIRRDSSLRYSVQLLPLALKALRLAGACCSHRCWCRMAEQMRWAASPAAVQLLGPLQQAGRVHVSASPRSLAELRHAGRAARRVLSPAPSCGCYSRWEPVWALPVQNVSLMAESRTEFELQTESLATCAMQYPSHCQSCRCRAQLGAGGLQCRPPELLHRSRHLYQQFQSRGTLLTVSANAPTRDAEPLLCTAVTRLGELVRCKRGLGSKSKHSDANEG